MLGDVGLPELVHVAEQDAGHVEGDISLADDDGVLSHVEPWIQGSVFRKAVVPAYKGASRVHALQVLARDAQLLVLGGAVGEDDGIVMGGQLGERDLGADSDVANVVEA